MKAPILRRQSVQSACLGSPLIRLASLLVFAIAPSLAPCYAQQASAPAKPPPIPAYFVPRTADDARAVLRAAEEEHPGDSIEVAQALATVALMESAYEKSTDGTLAEAQRAVRIAEKVKGKESPQYAFTLAIEARVHSDMDRPDLARPMAEEALAIGQRTGARSGAMANILSSLNIACFRQDDLDCAVHVAQLQVDLAREKEATEPTYLASALNSLASNLRRKADLPAMEKVVNELLDLKAKQTNLDDPIWVTTENTANLYFSGMHQYDKARDHLLIAIDLSIHQLGPDDLDQS
ncbi:MAG TPA: tetratricopeptide repeat protein, partial [Terracidiphilus sp.]|nr:tetratricopeptide repeat protein [Terracidiphilus sp.]